MRSIAQSLLGMPNTQIKQEEELLGFLEVNQNENGMEEEKEDEKT